MIDIVSSTVFVVESLEENRRKLNQLLSSMNFERMEFQTAEEFLRLAGHHRRGCVIAGLRLDGMSGLELQDRMKQARSPLPFLIVSERVSTPIVVRAMRSGAVGFLDIPVKEDDLWLAVREAMSENDNRIALEDEKTDLLARFGRLSEGEQEVLERVCEGLSNKEIALQLDVSLRTIESRRRRLLEKTSCRSFPELLLTYQTFRNRFADTSDVHGQVY